MLLLYSRIPEKNFLNFIRKIDFTRTNVIRRVSKTDVALVCRKVHVYSPLFIGRLNLIIVRGKKKISNWKNVHSTARRYFHDNLETLRGGIFTFLSSNVPMEDAASRKRWMLFVRQQRFESESKTFRHPFSAKRTRLCTALCRCLWHCSIATPNVNHWRFPSRRKSSELICSYLLPRRTRRRVCLRCTVVLRACCSWWPSYAAVSERICLVSRPRCAPSTGPETAPCCGPKWIMLISSITTKRAGVKVAIMSYRSRRAAIVSTAQDRAEIGPFTTFIV